MKTPNRFTEVAFLGTMLPDYFNGYSFPVVAIPCHNNMTASEIAEEIESEINATWEYLTDMDHGFKESEMKLFDKYCNELRKKGDEIMITGIEESEDGDEYDFETVYSYFSLCKPVFKYGMQFLNA